MPICLLVHLLSSHQTTATKGWQSYDAVLFEKSSFHPLSVVFIVPILCISQSSVFYFPSFHTKRVKGLFVILENDDHRGMNEDDDDEESDGDKGNHSIELSRKTKQPR